ncbi:MAG: M23 family metallopeptidase, partial [Mycobacteriales bacterium]
AAPVAPRVLPRRASRSRALPTRREARKAHTATRWVRPSYAAVVSPFGMRWGRMHKGVDFGASYGAPIHAIGAGVVVGAGYQAEESGYGQITLIRHADGIVSAYAHQSQLLVHVGEHVEAGEVIGYVGDTGHVTGPHLHFEIRTSTHGGQIDPVAWLRRHGVDV